MDGYKRLQVLNREIALIDREIATEWILSTPDWPATFEMFQEWKKTHRLWERVCNLGQERHILGIRINA